MASDQLTPPPARVDLYWLPLGAGDNTCVRTNGRIFGALMAWLLARSGHDLDFISPPVRGRAPGWTAGRVVAERSTRHVAHRA
jgi:hypothetical protein